MRIDNSAKVMLIFAKLIIDISKNIGYTLFNFFKKGRRTK